MRIVRFFVLFLSFGAKLSLTKIAYSYSYRSVPGLANDRFRANGANHKVNNIRDTIISRMIHDYYDSGCLMASSAPCCETLPLIVVELGEVEPSLFLFPHVSVLFFSFFFPSDNCVSRRLTGLLLAQLERIFQAFMRAIFAPRFSRGGKKNFIINSKLKALRFSKLCRYALSFEKKKNHYYVRYLCHVKAWR